MSIWHPCSQMKDYEVFKPLKIKRAYGSMIEVESGNSTQMIIDAISSWWCKSLGHGHPRLQQVVQSQMERFEHVIFANTTHDTIIELSERLLSLVPTKHCHKVFYAGDGSCAVEIAMKMSLHARQLTGNIGDQKRRHFIALKQGYHGETLGALAVSDLGIYKAPYEEMLLKPLFISGIPYVSGVEDPLWSDCSEVWASLQPILASYADIATALILEPIVQGAGGMLIYSADFLKRLAVWAKQNNIHLIADEIMTGMGRTGTYFATEHAHGVEPDFICLSKGLTSGWMPFSAVLTTQSIYDLFYDDYEKGKSFLHSHTYSGHALGARIALEVLHIMKEENTCDQAKAMQVTMRCSIQSISEETGMLTNIRGIGGMIAVDLVVDSFSGSSNHSNQRLGFELYQKAIQKGVLLRPLGNTIYWMPPLNTSEAILLKLAECTLEGLMTMQCIKAKNRSV